MKQFGGKFPRLCAAAVPAVGQTVPLPAAAAGAGRLWRAACRTGHRRLQIHLPGAGAVPCGGLFCRSAGRPARRGCFAARGGSGFSRFCITCQIYKKRLHIRILSVILCKVLEERGECDVQRISAAGHCFRLFQMLVRPQMRHRCLCSNASFFGQTDMRRKIDP